MKIIIANKNHLQYVDIIRKTIKNSAKIRGTGIAERSEEYLTKKIVNGDAIIALQNNKFAGFCYVEAWDNKTYVAHSGLIVHPDFRNLGLAKKIKRYIFEHSKQKYPNAKIFGITTSLAVMKINHELGYKPVTFSELTSDETFWEGCKSCKNYDILIRNNKKMCLCTGMLYNKDNQQKKKRKINFIKKFKHKFSWKKK